MVQRTKPIDTDLAHHVSARFCELILNGGAEFLTAPSLISPLSVTRHPHDAMHVLSQCFFDSKSVCRDILSCYLSVFSGIHFFVVVEKMVMFFLKMGELGQS